MMYVKRFVQKTGVCTVVDSRTGESRNYSLEDLNDLRLAKISVKGLSESGDFAYPVELLPNSNKTTFVYCGRRIGKAPFTVYLRGGIKLPCGNATERAYCDIDSSVYDLCGKSSTCHGLFATFVDSDKRIRTYPAELIDINDTDVYLKIKGKSANDDIRKFTYYGYEYFPVNQNVWKRVDLGKCMLDHKRVGNTSVVDAISGFLYFLSQSYFIDSNNFNKEVAMALTRESLTSGRGLVYFNEKLWVPLQELLLNFISMTFNIEKLKGSPEYRFTPRVIDSSLLLPRGQENGILSFLIDLFYPADTNDLCIFGDEVRSKIIRNKTSVGDAILRRADDLVPLARVEIDGGFCPEDGLADIVSVLTRNDFSGCVFIRSHDAVLCDAKRVVHTLRGSFSFESSICKDFLGMVDSSDKDIKKSIAKGKLSSDGEMTINAKGEVIVGKLPSNGDLKFLDKGLYITSSSLDRNLNLSNMKRIFLPASYRSVSRDMLCNPSNLPITLHELVLVSKNKRLGVVMSMINAVYVLEERFNAITATINIQTGSGVHEQVGLKFGFASEKPTLLAALLCSDYSRQGVVDQLIRNADFFNSFTDQEIESFYEILSTRVLCEGKLYNKARIRSVDFREKFNIWRYHQYLIMGRDSTNLISSAKAIESQWSTIKESGLSQDRLQLLSGIVEFTKQSELALVERVKAVCSSRGILFGDESTGYGIELRGEKLPSFSEDSE